MGACSPGFHFHLYFFQTHLGYGNMNFTVNIRNAFTAYINVTCEEKKIMNAVDSRINQTIPLKKVQAILKNVKNTLDKGILRYCFLKNTGTLQNHSGKARIYVTTLSAKLEKVRQNRGEVQEWNLVGTVLMAAMIQRVSNGSETEVEEQLEGIIINAIMSRLKKMRESVGKEPEEMTKEERQKELDHIQEIVNRMFSNELLWRVNKTNVTANRVYANHNSDKQRKNQKDFSTERLGKEMMSQNNLRYHIMCSTTSDRDALELVLNTLELNDAELETCPKQIKVIKYYQKVMVTLERSKAENLPNEKMLKQIREMCIPYTQTTNTIIVGDDYNEWDEDPKTGNQQTYNIKKHNICTNKKEIKNDLNDCTDKFYGSRIPLREQMKEDDQADPSPRAIPRGKQNTIETVKTLFKVSMAHIPETPMTHKNKIYNPDNNNNNNNNNNNTHKQQ